MLLNVCGHSGIFNVNFKQISDVALVFIVEFEQVNAGWMEFCFMKTWVSFVSQDINREIEDKFRKAMVNSAQLDNERQAFQYQVECLKDM